MLRSLLLAVLYELGLLVIVVVTLLGRARRIAAAQGGDFLSSVPMPRWWLPLAILGPLVIIALRLWRRKSG